MEGNDVNTYIQTKVDRKTEVQKSRSFWIRNTIVATFFLAVAIPGQSFAGYRTTFPHNYLFSTPHPLKNGEWITFRGRLQAQIPGPNPGWAKNVPLLLYVNGSNIPIHGRTDSNGYFSIRIRYWHNKPIPKNGTYVRWHVNSVSTPVYNPATSGGAGKSFLVVP